MFLRLLLWLAFFGPSTPMDRELPQTVSQTRK